MACFMLKDIEGNTRWVEQNTVYQKVNGEAIVEGMINWECGESSTTPDPTDAIAIMIQELDQKFKEEGLGEWIKVFAEPVAKSLGKSGCTSCDVRRVVGDALGPLIAKHGRWEAAKITIKLVKDSFIKPELDVLKELKGYLEVSN